VPVAEVVTSPLVRRNPQLEARGFFERLEHPEAGAQDYAGLPFRPAPATGWCRRPPPTLGQHNEEVLGDEAGLSVLERAELRRAQVIGDRPRGL
jgi:crotonobetainyl-CoA:carnitine CoA-transferase CaiB-like acyl-CoA transferase